MDAWTSDNVRNNYLHFHGLLYDVIAELPLSSKELRCKL